MALLGRPIQLITPFFAAGKIASKVMLDLTVYLRGPSERELEYLIDLYNRMCPVDRLVDYKIAELEYWSPLAQPALTASGRSAAAVRIRRPYLEPVRQRIRDSRAFEIRCWDRREIDDPNGSWSFACQRIHLRSMGLRAFVRILLPLGSDTEILRNATSAIADNVEFFSGHGGLVFVYDPWLKGEAFDAIYAQARRFWGVDVEDLNGTLPLMNKGIKGVNWITIVGNKFAATPGIPEALAQLAATPNVQIEKRQHGTVLIAGPQPVVGDQHRPDNSLDPYYAVARVLEPLFLTAHPDFSSERWVKNGNTIGWIRRFINPAGWR